MTRNKLFFAALLLVILSFGADAQSIGGMGGIANLRGGASAPPPVSCIADGKTDWSNACDLPLLAAVMGF
jgi:hypothetical protein